MKTALILITLAAAASTTQPAHARKACDELKQEIAAKIDANGVKQYSLDIVAPDAVGERKVVGSCDGGTQRIVYQRGATTASAAVTAGASTETTSGES